LSILVSSLSPPCSFRRHSKNGPGTTFRRVAS
jgi:hypothetical protein